VVNNFSEQWTRSEPIGGNTSQFAPQLFDPQTYEGIGNLHRYEPNNQSTLTPASGDSSFRMNSTAVVLNNIILYDSEELSGSEISERKPDYGSSGNRHREPAIQQEIIQSFPPLIHPFVSYSRDQIGVMTAEQPAGLGRLNLMAFGPEQMSALRADQVARFTPQQIADFTGEQLRSLSPEATRALNRQQIQALSSEQVAGVAPLLSPAQVSHLSADQIRRLPGVDRNLIVSMNREQLGAITPEQMRTVRSFISTLPVDTIRAFSPAQIGVVSTLWMTPEQVESLSDAQRQSILRNSMDRPFGVRPHQ